MGLMTLRITTLSENTAGSGDLLAEWGLSFLIETGRETILFDTGKTTSVTHNSPGLGIDLSRIDKIVLSHGHYDHTGGLRQLLRRMKQEVEIIAHPDIWANKYRRRKNEKVRYIGIPFQRQELESLGARFTLTKEPVKVADDIITTGEVPMSNDYEIIDSGLMVKTSDGSLQPDPLLDDLALIITTGYGLVVVLGCAHRGIINTLFHARKLTGVAKIYAALGGSHLVNAPKERMRRTIGDLKELGVEKLGLCHCTSLPAINRLSVAFGDTFIFTITGSVFELA
jgi:7,8-dihydropterin-6-yl-methyl-4-(beta-D-ribofuranosyl)aminobenzene 5'-phosphate synthase